MKSIHIILFFVLIQWTNAQTKFDIWPNNELKNTKELTIERIDENQRLVQIKSPELYFFPALNSENDLPTILLIPGGGYHHVTYGIYGFEYAKWLNQNGINAFVLNYRLPLSPDLTQPDLAPLQDAQMAMKFIRKNQKEFKLNSIKIGVLGISAGGHLVAQLSNFNDKTELKNDWNKINTKPDFAILISPVIDFATYKHQGSVDNLLGKNPTEELINQYSLQNKVNQDTPPTLLIHATDDTAVPYQNSVIYFEKLQANKIKSSLYLLPFGNHNLTIQNNKNMADSWKNIVLEWIKLNQ